MSTIAESGLFPAIMDAYAPAYNLNDVLLNGLSINYSISDFNDPGDIHGVHVSIIRQSNYQSLFNPEAYPMGIYVANVTTTEKNNTITIDRTAFTYSQLSYNEYYKVQVRLSKDTSFDPTQEGTGVALSNYLTDEAHLVNFSEWSTVCLIRFIAPNTLTLQGNGQPLPYDSGVYLTTSSLTLNGKYTKLDITDASLSGLDTDLKNGDNDKEYLYSFKVSVYEQISQNEEEFKFNSENINVDIAHNTEVYYSIPYYFETDKTYNIKIRYITANLYEREITYPIQCIYPETGNWAEQNLVDEMVSIDSIIGKVNISILPRQTQIIDEQEVPIPIPAGSRFTIRRGSDEDDFVRWDTLWDKTLTEDLSTNLSLNDFTIESGVIYKYEITYTPVEPPSGNITGYSITEGPILSVFDHAFLTGEGTQLAVKFNPNISTFKRNVSDNVVTTIGGKYPFITRNSNMDYRTFTLSGTIAYEMDLEHQFTSRSDIYGDWIEVYGSYFVNRFINQQNDRITQRKFRELVLNFLCDDIPKLFRSTPEGNILVRITDVSLTPNQQLSRMIYDFSCTATEIGESSIENCKLYKIQDFD